jgi:hypothetical protein
MQPGRLPRSVGIAAETGIPAWRMTKSRVSSQVPVERRVFIHAHA